MSREGDAEEGVVASSRQPLHLDLLEGPYLLGHCGCVCMGGMGIFYWSATPPTNRPIDRPTMRLTRSLRAHTYANQASYGDGQVQLFLYRARRIVLEEDPDCVCLCYQIEPCPSSKCASFCLVRFVYVSILTTAGARRRCSRHTFKPTDMNCPYILFPSPGT